ncbi:uncharacterized protein B0H64DRAFT_403381 [Chaetomium fimeti]|uniref:Uncharacterized protein n=1 Tax=Chaetomium fimeti TaxID=1854472 RepID=A0AAE0HAN0_9PEZI|nr:hypothetical protein B0H64DRAFT_403381 [Chaetomium fimeti]
MCRRIHRKSVCVYRFFWPERAWELEGCSGHGRVSHCSRISKCLATNFAFSLIISCMLPCMPLFHSYVDACAISVVAANGPVSAVVVAQTPMAEPTCHIGREVIVPFLAFSNMSWRSAATRGKHRLAPASLLRVQKLRRRLAPKLGALAPFFPGCCRVVGTYFVSLIRSQ